MWHRARFILASNLPWKQNLVERYGEICEELERFRSARQAPSQTDICVNRMGARHICQGKRNTRCICTIAQSFIALGLQDQIPKKLHLRHCFEQFKLQAQKYATYKQTEVCQYVYWKVTKHYWSETQLRTAVNVRPSPVTLKKCTYIIPKKLAKPMQINLDGSENVFWKKMTLWQFRYFKT